MRLKKKYVAWVVRTNNDQHQTMPSGTRSSELFGVRDVEGAASPPTMTNVEVEGEEASSSSSLSLSALLSCFSTSNPAFEGCTRTSLLLFAGVSALTLGLTVGGILF